MRFTIYHGLAASLILHLLLAAPFVVHGLTITEDEPPVIVIDLKGVVEDDQSEQQVIQQTKAVVQQETVTKENAPEVPPPTVEPPPPPPEAVEHPSEEPQVSAPTPPPAPVAPKVDQKPGPDTKDVAGVDQSQIARTIKTDREERDAISDYVKVLSKKIRANIVSPGEGRTGSAVVSFTIRTDGHIRPESLKVIESSGQPKLDASALQTVRASVPFETPPEELTIAIAVDFERKH